MSAPDTWSEVALIAIAASGGTEVAYQAITETVDIYIGDKDFDVINTLAGGRLIKFTPQEPTSITLEAYPVEAGTVGLATAATGTGFFDLVTTVDNTATNGLIYPVDRQRTKYRIAIMWTDASNITAAGQVVAPTNYALRVVAADGYFTSVKPSFTDGLLKFTVTYKVPAFDKSGNACVAIMSVGGSATATMTALVSYTAGATAKW